MNFGGVKNNHDRMCVHTQDNIDYRNWGETHFTRVRSFEVT